MSRLLELEYRNLYLMQKILPCVLPFVRHELLLAVAPTEFFARGGTRAVA